MFPRPDSSVGLVQTCALGGFFLLTACSDSSAPDADSGAGADTGAATDASADTGETGCTADSDCSDGVFCNGVERCMPGAATANRFGCTTGSEPCLESQQCDEAATECLSDCDTNPDADGDGSESSNCGGDDCDDADSNRFPGNPEVCDAIGHDEDCDPNTLGDDADSDGVVSAMCCNVQEDGSNLCGADCNDANAEINPGAIEVCNGADDDCNGLLDHPQEDNDMDGHADDSCAGEAGSDCDDNDPTIYDGAPELCDGKDNDCGGGPEVGEDADGDGLAAEDSPCLGGVGTLPKTDCDDSNADVRPGGTETCNGIDDNCDGVIDEEPAATTSCGNVTGGTAACDMGACVIASCNGTLAHCDSSFANGCETDTATDLAHCGACMSPCDLGSNCTAGICRPVRVLSWATDVTGSSGQFDMTAMDADSSGNIYFAGVLGANSSVDMGTGTLSTSGAQGILVGRFDADGTPAWGRVIEDTTGGNDCAEELDLAVEPSGNVYVVGSCTGTMNFGGGNRARTRTVFFIASYGPNGSYRWDRTGSDDANSNGRAVAIMTRFGTTSVHAVGGFNASTRIDGTALTNRGSGDIFAARWSTSGAKSFVSNLGGAGHEVARDLALNPTDNRAIVAGTLNGSSTYGSANLSSSGVDALVLRYDAGSGAAQTAQAFGSTSSDAALAVAWDLTTRDMYVGVQFRGSVDFGDGSRTAVGGTADIAILRFNLNFFFLSSHHFPGDGADTITSLFADNQRIFAAGDFSGNIDLGAGPHDTRGGSDIWVMERTDRTLDNLAWSRTFGNSDINRNAQVVQLSSGDVVVSGSFAGTLDTGGSNVVSTVGNDGFFVRLTP